VSETGEMPLLKRRRNCNVLNECIREVGLTCRNHTQTMTGIKNKKTKNTWCSEISFGIAENNKKPDEIPRK